MNTSLIKIAAPIGVLMSGIGAYVLLDATKPEPEKKEEPPRALSVFVHSVNRSDIPLKVTTQGEVRARTQVDIVAQVSGRIVEVSPEFIEGGVVKPGDPLVVIESTDYEFAVKSSRAQVAEAEVRLQQALADADVARKQLRDSKDPSPLALKKPQVASVETGKVPAPSALANFCVKDADCCSRCSSASSQCRSQNGLRSLHANKRGSYVPCSSRAWAN